MLPPAKPRVWMPFLLIYTFETLPHEGERCSYRHQSHSPTWMNYFQKFSRWHYVFVYDFFWRGFCMISVHHTHSNHKQIGRLSMSLNHIIWKIFHACSPRSYAVADLLTVLWLSRTTLLSKWETGNLYLTMVLQDYHGNNHVIWNVQLFFKFLICFFTFSDVLKLPFLTKIAGRLDNPDSYALTDVLNFCTCRS